MDRCVIAGAVVCLVLALRSDDTASFVLPTFFGIVADVLDVEMDTEGDCKGRLGFSDIPPSGIIDICSGIPVDLSPTKDKSKGVSIFRLSSGRDVF